MPKWRTFGKAVLFIGVLGAALTVGTLSESLPLRLALGLLMGPFVFGLASIGHEAGHLTASRWRLLNDLTGSLSMSLLGIPARGWKTKHDLHHRFGGVPGRDTDSDPVLEDYVAKTRAARLWLRIYGRYQFLLWWATPFGLMVTSWTWAIRNLRARDSRFARRTRWTVGDMAISAAFFASVGLYLVFAGWVDLLLLVALPFAVTGVIAAVCFVPNHRGMPPLTEEQAHRPARYAWVNTRTILYPRSVPANYFMNYVPWQIEHHVFPTVAGFRLPALSEHLRTFAQREGIPLRYETAPQALPRMLSRRWMWGRADGRLYTIAEAEAIARRVAAARRPS